jgi:predicted metal-dependent enzyme (double-stranded beta helix superfamily)
VTEQAISRRSVILGVTGLLASQAARSQGGGSARSRFDKEQFVDDIRRARGDSDGQAAVESVLRRAVERPGDVLSALGEPTTAGIHTIYRGDDVTILNVVWAPMMVLLPHNHNMWASIGIYTGREDNIIWERSGGLVTATGAASLEQKEVFGLSEDAIHSVINPIGRLTGAIHVYGGDFFAPGRSEWDSETLIERPFDLDGARDEFRRAADRFHAVP